MASTPTNPDHYSRWKIQPWDFISQNNLDFIRGNIIKYIMRYDAKNGLEDLKKARVYLDKLISNLTNELQGADEVQQMWMTSLYHITERDNAILTKNALNTETFNGSLYIFRHDAGFFVAADKDVAYPSGLSNYFENLIAHCYDKKYHWLNLERDTMPHEQFQVFQW